MANQLHLIPDLDDDEPWNPDAAMRGVRDELLELVRSWPEHESIWPLQVLLEQWTQTVKRLEARKQGRDG